MMKLATSVLFLVNHFLIFLELIPFNLMFDGIEYSFRSNVVIEMFLSMHKHTFLFLFIKGGGLISTNCVEIHMDVMFVVGMDPSMISIYFLDELDFCIRRITLGFGLYVRIR